MARAKKKKKSSNRSIIILLLLVCILLVILVRRGTIDLASMTSSNEDTVNVLFIGNSFTFYHDMPKMLEVISKREPDGIIIRAEMESRPGVSLEHHYLQGQARNRIAEGHWDYVILQEQSAMPLTNRSKMERYVKLFADDINKIEAIAILYAIWADNDRPQDLDSLNRVNFEIARRAKMLVAPVGSAFKEALESDNSIRLYASDQHHPSLEGSYLAARVFYAVIAEDWGKEEGAALPSFLVPGLPPGISSQMDSDFKNLSEDL